MWTGSSVWGKWEDPPKPYHTSHIILPFKGFFWQSPTHGRVYLSVHNILAHRSPTHGSQRSGRTKHQGQTDSDTNILSHAKITQIYFKLENISCSIICLFPHKKGERVAQDHNSLDNCSLSQCWELKIKFHQNSTVNKQNKYHLNILQLHSCWVSHTLSMVQSHWI